MAIIRLGAELLPRSSDQPENDAGNAIVFLFGLAADGVYPALCVAAQAVGAYPAVSPLPVRAKARHRRFIFCGTFRRVTTRGR